MNLETVVLFRNNQLDALTKKVVHFDQLRHWNLHNTGTQKLAQK